MQSRTNNALVQTFTVDSLNQLSNVTRSGTLTVAGKAGQGVPPVSVTVNGQAASLYADWMFARAGFSLVDGTNSFTAIATDSTPASVTNDLSVWLPATATFQYDSNGNLLSDGRRAFAWNDENQLTSVLVTNQWKSEFTYDGKLRRRVRKEFTWSSAMGDWQLTNEVRYVYDGNLVLQERDSNNAPRVTYTRGRDLSGSFEGAGGIGGLLARSEISNQPSAITTHAFYHADGNGNITALINPQAAIVARYHYDPYGNLLARSGSLADANLYRFSSKEVHGPSGLVYYLYRYYAPDLQRWPNRDPLGEPGFEALHGAPEFDELARVEQALKASAVVERGANFYAHVHNNPLNRVDPLGLVSLPPGWDGPNKYDPNKNPFCQPWRCSRFACRAACASAAAAGAYACTQIGEPRASGACWAAVTLFAWLCTEACALCPDP